MNWWRIVAYGVVVVAALSAAAGWGYHRGVLKLYEYQAEQAKAAVKIVVKQGAVTERVVTKFIKGRDRVKVITETIEKEIVRYAESNPGSCLDGRWRRLHDAAAAGALPPAPGPADAAAGAPKAAAAVATVTENYAACRRNADRLEALQEWVQHQALLNAPAP